MVRFRPEAPFADLAHPVERHLAKVKVASSSLVIRSTKTKTLMCFRLYNRHHSQGVRQRSATPLSPVQIWVVPPKNSKSPDLEFFYPSRQAWHIITTQSCISSPKAYIITPSGVYICRLDDIQNFVLMICNSFLLSKLSRDFSRCIYYSFDKAQNYLF